jgi:hypothetical protein
MGTPEIVELLYFDKLPRGWELGQKQAGQSTTPDKDPQPTNGTKGKEGNVRETKESDAIAKSEPTRTSEIFTLEEAIHNELVIEVNRSRCHTYTNPAQLTPSSARLP